MARYIVALVAALVALGYGGCWLSGPLMARPELEQLALSPQCGFSSGIGGNTMDVAAEIAKLRLVVETAREVWGDA